jgi:DnaD/phage-associated family protein
MPYVKTNLRMIALKKITIDLGAYPFFTSISNNFIDFHMPNANGDFVKVYLFILRCLTTLQKDLSVTLIADALNLTEADVVRALKYWSEHNLLKVDSKDQDFYTIQVLLPENVSTKTTVENELNTDPTPSNMIPKNNIQKPTYTPSEVKKFTNNDSIKQLIYVTQKYLGKMLSQTELNTLISFNDWLGLPYDVIEYLIEYCVTNQHRSLRYIEKVAITWSENNIDTIEKAEQYIQIFNKQYFAIMKAFGLGSRNPALPEIKFMKKWIEQYQFDISIILEACSRTIQAIHQPSFEYADTILESWHKKKVRNFEDITALDHTFSKNKQKPEINPPKTNNFLNYNQRDYNFDELEKKARERLINKASESR